MKKDLNYILAVLVVMLSVIVIAMGVYFYFEDNGNNLLEDNCECDSGVNDEISKQELSKFGESDFNIIKLQSSGSHSFALDVNGKVIVDFDKTIDNVFDVKDIVLFSTSLDESFLYILTKSGELYKYDILNIENSEFAASKVEEYSNIERIMTYDTRKANAGGCSFIILVDSDSKYYELNSFCV